jgi:hemolysin III
MRGRNRTDNNAWWLPRRRFSLAELIADGIVHSVGLLAGLTAGALFLAFGILRTAPHEAPALIVYIGTLLAVLSVSMAYNLWPASPVKQVLARLDQAAIFLFIAGAYTPFLAILGDGTANLLLLFVWSAALIGIALKLIVPQHFGRLAILLYLGIGWSGVLVFGQLAATLPAAALYLLVAGGVLYSLGIIFHLWEKLRFQNALWHGFVVTAAMLHLGAMLDCLVFSRL